MGEESVRAIKKEMTASELRIFGFILMVMAGRWWWLGLALFLGGALLTDSARWKKVKKTEPPPPLLHFVGCTGCGTKEMLITVEADRWFSACSNCGNEYELGGDGTMQIVRQSGLEPDYTDLKPPR